MTLRFEPQHKFHPHLRRSRRHPDRLCAQALVRMEGGRISLLYSFLCFIFLLINQIEICQWLMF